MTGCGTGTASWRLQVLPGQRINITLVDFSWAAVPSGSGTSATRLSSSGGPATTVSVSATAAVAFPVDCRVYAVVREMPETVGVTVCGGETRAKTIFVSRSHSVDLQLINEADRSKSMPSKNNYAFVFVYEGLNKCAVPMCCV